MSALRILYVDDDPDIREVAELSLLLDGRMTVETADSGAAALALLDAGFEPDALLLDVMMPGLDGPQTLDLIRQRQQLANTPAIFVTARAFHDEQMRLMTHNVRGVIIKPFDPQGFAGEVRKLLDN